MAFDWKYWRPLVLGLAAACFAAGVAAAQPVPLAERIQNCAAPAMARTATPRWRTFPSIAGQPAFFILNQLILMRERVRPVEAMAPFVKDLKDDDATALADHFAKLPAKPSDEKIDPALVKRGEELAERAALRLLPSADAGGAGANPARCQAARRLSDQVAEGIPRRTRPGADTNMSVPVVGLSDADLAALAHYAASR